MHTVFLAFVSCVSAVLVFALFCKFGPEKRKFLEPDEGNQTLIQYNQEGGSSPCTTKPNFFQSPVDNIAVTDDQMDTMQIDTGPYDINRYNSSVSTMFSTWKTNTQKFPSVGMHQQDTFRSHGKRSMRTNSTWKSNRTNTYRAGSSFYQRSLSLRSADRIEDHINRRCNEVDGNVVDHPAYQPRSYAFEGEGSICQSLDKLSFHDMGEDFKYLDDLGPKFKTLGQMYDEAIKKKKVQL